MTFQKSNLNDIRRIASRLDWMDDGDDGCLIRRERRSVVQLSARGGGGGAAVRWPHLPATFGPPAVIFIDIPQIWRRGGSLSLLGDPSLLLLHSVMARMIRCIIMPVVVTRAARLLSVGLHVVKKGDTPNAYLLTLQRPKCILRLRPRLPPLSPPPPFCSARN